MGKWTTATENGCILILNPDGMAVANLNVNPDGNLPMPLQRTVAREMLAALNRASNGGSAKSKAKARAAVENGKKGGRPKGPFDEMIRRAAGALKKEMEASEPLKALLKK